jgi:hypothetical protein
MQEDENIKSLLQAYGIEETSSTFNNNVMQKITAASFKKETEPLLNIFILKLLKIAFFIIAVLIVLCVCFIPSNNFRVEFAVNLNSNIYGQLFSFIIVFWVMMLINLLWNKRWSTGNESSS